MNFPHYTKQELSIYPKAIPKGLIHTLIISCLLLGLSGMRKHHGLDGWLSVLDNWFFMLLWIPTGVTLCALPFKLRDDSFELKLAYYLGMFVAFLFVLNRLRYWR
ncbi:MULTISPECIES: hypothetical protein [unclassified Moraxella]|uniref:hypothetical protein n=1 Tax=unclassified Moraxella TaxID=2685852 RepID=UPI003AF6334C